MRIGSSAVAWAQAQTSWHPSGMCQQFSRSAFGVGSYYGSAALAWREAQHKHRQSGTSGIPAGVPVFWTGGSRGFGHVAISLGNGLCRSTDWPYSTRVGTARISDISRAWNLDFVGWTEDINRVRVYTPPKPKPKPSLDISNIIRATKAQDKIYWGRKLKKAVAEEVGKGGMDLRTSRLGAGFREQYKLVQRKYLKSIGEQPTGHSADGIPGRASLAWLGKRHGFTVEK